MYSVHCMHTVYLICHLPYVHVYVLICSKLCYLQYSLKQLSNMIKVESLHSTLREDEMVYWSKYFIKSISSLRETASSHKQKRGWEQLLLYIYLHVRTVTIIYSSYRNPSSSVKGVPDILRMVMTSSAVTTMEATDWSMSMRMDTPTLQAKDPLVQAVSASCAINLQWTNPDTDNTSAIVRYTYIYR